MEKKIFLTVLKKEGVFLFHIFEFMHKSHLYHIAKGRDTPRNSEEEDYP